MGKNVDQISEIVLNLTSDTNKIDDLFRFFDGDQKLNKRVAAAEKAIMKDYNKHPRDFTKSEPLTGHYSNFVRGYKIDNKEKYPEVEAGLMYWLSAQKLILENDEYIYSLMVNFYLVLVTDVNIIAVPICLSSRETTLFEDLQYWMVKLKDQLPPHVVFQCNYDNHNDDNSIIYTTEMLFEGHLEEMGIQLAVL